MRLLDRHLLKEMLLPFAFCLGGFFVFWSAAELIGEMEDLQKARLHGLEVVEFTLLRAPEKLVYLLPVALMLGLLYALTQHTKNNEITAMRTAGISLWRIGVPYLGFGLFLTFALFAANELVTPAAQARADNLLRRHAQSGPRTDRLVTGFGFVNGGAQRRWAATSFNFDTTEMRTVDVTEDLPGNIRRVTRADRAIYTNGGWAFFKVEQLRGPWPGPELAKSAVTNYLFKREFTETPDEMWSDARVAKARSIRRIKQAEVPISVLLDYRRLHPKLPPGDTAWLYTHLHGRLAAPWTCVVVVMLALPFSTMTGRRNVFVGVAGSIFICFAFFIVAGVGLAFGTSGWLPPWLAAWLPNLLFGTLAVTMTARAR
jgi:LPS export ABC transporter permease LptG